LCQKMQIHAKRSIGGGDNKVDRKVSRWNIAKRSQKLFGHPLTLKAHLRGEHPSPTCPTKRKNKRSRSKHDAQNLDIVQRATKIGRRKEVMKQFKRRLGRAFAGLDHMSHNK
jgi:hypothetical protein